MQKIISNRTDIYYEYHKSNRKPTLVFLHGWGANNTIWKKEFDYFKNKGYGTLNPDLRGHGLSVCSKKPRFYEFSKDLKSIMDNAKISKAIFVGHSMGGLVGLDFYAKYPNKVSALILIDSSYKISLQTLKFFVPLEFIFMKIINYFAKKRKNKPKRMDFQKFKGASDFRILYEMNSSLDAFPYGEDILKDLLKLDFSPILKKIRIPILVISSMEDEFFRVDVSRAMSKRIPEGHFCEINGTHSSIIKKPHEVSSIIGKFIANSL